MKGGPSPPSSLQHHHPATFINTSLPHRSLTVPPPLPSHCRVTATITNVRQVMAKVSLLADQAEFGYAMSAARR